MRFESSAVHICISSKVEFIVVILKHRQELIRNLLR